MRRKQRAFTLVELLIVSGIFAVIMSALFLSFRSGIKAYSEIQDKLKSNQETRRFLQRIILDLRNSFAWQSEKTYFSGGKGNISFLTIVDSYSAGSKSTEFAFVAYERQENGVITRLCRRGKDSLNLASDTRADELLSQVKELRLSYGYTMENEKTLNWKETWSDANLMPEAIKIGLVFSDKRDAIFEQTVYLPIS